MIRQHTSRFGPVEQMTARALLDAGQSDAEIALAIGTSVNNILHWRRENNLGVPAATVSAPVAPPPPNRLPALIPAKPAPQPVPAVNDAGSQPAGDNAILLGRNPAGGEVHVDLAELLATRLLVQGNSGSGKSHLLRKLIEETSGLVQQVIVDPEGDFASLAETFGHTVVDASAFSSSRIAEIGGKARRHRGSIVLNLEALDSDQQMDTVAEFLNGLFHAPREHWHPVLVFVDEAQLFAPAAAGDEDKSTRKASLGAVTNLMCRGRKRGLAGILATQRIAKLHKNVAAEASNFLIGRTFLDIDIARSADLIGLPTKQAEVVRDLKRGEFLGLGPAVSRRTLRVTVGDVLTGPHGGPSGITPLPDLRAEDLSALMLASDEPEPAPALRVVK